MAPSCDCIVGGIPVTEICITECPGKKEHRRYYSQVDAVLNRIDTSVRIGKKPKSQLRV